MNENTIAAGEFKARCLKLMAVVQRSKMPLVITKRGTPIVRIEAYVEDAPESFFGCMSETASWASQDIHQQKSVLEVVNVSEHQEKLPDFLAESPAPTPDADAAVSAQESAGEADSFEFDAFLDDEIEIHTAPTAPASHHELHLSEQSRRPVPIRKTPPPNRGLPIRSEPVAVQDVLSTERDEEVEREDNIYVPLSTEKVQQNISMPEQPAALPQEESRRSAWLRQQLTSSWNRPSGESGGQS